MLSPIIHIGFPKTGTTWFYEAYYPKARDISLLPPESYLPQITEPSFSTLQYDPTIRLVLLHPELTGVRRFIWDGGELRKKIALSLKQKFPEATIIIFLRNQLDFLASVYLYYVRKGGTFSGSKIIDLMINKKIEFGLDYLKYDETIALYHSIFGKENVHLYLYEDFKNDPAGFIKKYTERYGFDTGNQTISYKPVNDRLRQGLMNFLRFTNHFTMLDNPFKTYYLNIEWIYRNLNEKSSKFNTYKIFGKKATTEKLFRPGQITFINDYFRSSNNELIKKFDVNDILKFNYPV